MAEAVSSIILFGEAQSCFIHHCFSFSYIDRKPEEIQTSQATSSD